MTDLAARLRATGIPECVEYADAPRHEVLVWGQLAKVVPESVADAMAARLLDENERLAMDRDGFRGAFNTCIERAEQAEAEVGKLDEALRSACRKWAACSDESVLRPPRIRNAGDGYEIVMGHRATDAEQELVEVTP